MKKNMYQLLNEVKIDFGEYEDLELSAVEKQVHKRRILREVRNMKKKGRIWKIAAGVAAACAVTVTAIGVTNPILAENMFSSVFGNLIHNAKGGKYEEEDTDRYAKIAKKSIDVQEEIDKQPDAKEYSTTAENNGVSISVSDIYCDGYMLYYTAFLQTDSEQLMQADWILSEFKTGGSQELTIEGVDLSGYASNGFRKAEDGTFVSANQIDLLSGVDEGFFSEEGGTIVLDWTLHRLKGSLYDSWDEDGEYASTATVDGEWHLRFPVTVDVSGRKAFEIEKEDNGVILKDAVRTKAGLVLHAELPDFRKEPYNDPYNDPDEGVRDAQGNYLQWLSQRWKENEDGTTECWIMVLYDGEAELTFEVTAKGEDAGQIAKIAFEVPEEAR